MAKLHHTQLKAAVLKYGSLLGTMPDDSLKAEIGKDEKLKVNVDEVFAAITEGRDDDSNSDDKVNSGNDNHEDDEQPEAFKEESLNRFLDSLTPEQSQILYNALADKLGTDKIDWEHLESLKSAQETSSSKKDDGQHFVVTRFRDISNFDLVYSPGQNVDHLPAKRLAELIEKGLVEKQ
jgi:hypothetical protein